MSSGSNSSVAYTTLIEVDLENFNIREAGTDSYNINDRYGRTHLIDRSAYDNLKSHYTRYMESSRSMSRSRQYSGRYESSGYLSSYSSSISRFISLSILDQKYVNAARAEMFHAQKESEFKERKKLLLL